MGISFFKMTYSKIITSPIFKETISFLQIYLFWTFTHFVACNLYHYWCVPKTWYYAILTPFYSQQPHCKVLDWVYTTSSKTVNSISTTIITWASKFVFNYMQWKY